MTNAPQLQDFLQQLQNIVDIAKPWKATLSKVRPKNRTTTNIYVKSIYLKEELQYSFTFRFPTKDEVHNYSHEEVVNKMRDLLTEDFYFCTVFTESEEWNLMQSKKGKTTFNVRNKSNPSQIDTSHNHEKKRLLQSSSPYLQSLGITDGNGRIFDKSQDKWRQINKFIEIIDHTLKDFPSNNVLRIADMGSGKGYLTFALYEYLYAKRKLQLMMTGFEIREDLVASSYQIAMENGFAGLSFQQQSIDEANVENYNMVIALHACDIATDMAIAKAIKANAEYIIVSPCCHKQIRKDMHPNNVLSPILKHGILEERQAEIVTDGLRALIMEQNGYKTQVFEFISSEHTSKNLMIIGTKTVTNADTSAQILSIKEFFAINSIYLEDLLK